MANPVEQAKEQMNKSVENTKENFAGIRTGRANPALLNGIVVDYYGAPTPLKAVASIGVPEPRTLSVTPFDVSQASKVEKALRDSDLGVNPNRDGKVAVRNIRRKAKVTIDKSVKDGEMGEDEGDRLLKELDKVTKQVTDQLDALFETKQKEIMEV